jgi:hypothetical protein
MRDLWGNDAEANESLLIDLWESYLDKDRVAAKPIAPKGATTRGKVVAKTSSKVAKVPRAAVNSRGSLKASAPSVKLASHLRQMRMKGTAKTGGSSITVGRKPGKPTRRGR